MPSLKTYIKLALLEAHGGQPVMETQDFIAGAFYMLKYLQRHTAMDMEHDPKESYHDIYKEMSNLLGTELQNKNRKDYAQKRDTDF